MGDTGHELSHRRQLPGLEELRLRFLQLAQLGANLFVESGVVGRQGRLVGDGHGEIDLGLRPAIGLGLVEVDRAQHRVLSEQRDHQQGARAERQPLRIGHLVDGDRPPGPDHFDVGGVLLRTPGPEGHILRPEIRIGVPIGELRHDGHQPSILPEIDRAALRADRLSGASGEDLQDFLELERRAHRVRDVEKRLGCGSGVIRNAEGHGPTYCMSRRRARRRFARAMK